MPRFEAYKAASNAVMSLLREASPIVEPLSLDEAYVDLEAGEHEDLSDTGVRAIARALKDKVYGTTGLTLSVGAGSSKLVAKIASDLDKPDGLLVIGAGHEDDVLRSLPATRLPGVGPATATRLRADASGRDGASRRGTATPSAARRAGCQPGGPAIGHLAPDGESVPRP